MAAKSRRVYITLNSMKEKDRVIEAYLSNSYSEADAIKEAIYRLATNSVQMIQNDINITEKVQLTNEKLNHKEVQKGDKSDDKVKSVPTELEMNELEELNKFL